MATIVEGNPKAPFSIATTPRCRGGRYSFPGLLYFTLDPYLIMLSVEQGGIKYHFLSLWYDSTWDWTEVSRAIGEHSNRYANVQLNTNKFHKIVWLQTSQFNSTNHRVSIDYFCLIIIICLHTLIYFQFINNNQCLYLGRIY